MSTRISSALLLVLAGCSSGNAPVQAQADEGAQRIDCAIGPGSEFGPDCLVERSEIGGATVLTVRQPDGGFRRFEQLADGRGVAVYDGADPAELMLHGDVLEVRVGEDRYRFPARSQGTDEGK